MRAMGCHAVLGYSEQTSIRDELIILSAIGTAAVIDMAYTLAAPPPPVLRQRQSSGTAALPASLSVDEDGTHHQQHLQRKLHVDVALANEIALNGLSTETARWLINHL